MYNIDNNILEFSCILSIVYTRIFVYNSTRKQEMTSPIQKNLVSQVLQSPINPTRTRRATERREVALMYSDYGFVLEGIEYATESEAREALAEMQA